MVVCRSGIAGIIWIGDATRVRLNEDKNMKLSRFWSDLSMWNKYGLSAVGAIGVLVLIFVIFF